MQGLPPGNNGVTYGGISNIQSGIYAIVESTTVENDSWSKSELLTPITLEVGSMDNGYVTGMRYYLATVDAFERPATIIPNIGGPNNAYLWLRSRDEWSTLFEQWLSAPVNLMNPAESEEDPSSDEDDPSSEEE